MASQWVGRLGPVCQSGSVLGCAISSFPWIIAGLGVVVLLLLGFRFFLFWRERRRPAPFAGPAPHRPPATKPGSPLVPPATTSSRAPKVPDKPAPLQLRVADAPDLELRDFQGSGHVQGDFGEMLTAVYLASQGWKRLPSKLHGGRGIDGLFAREVRGGGGFECLAIETKTNSANYDPAKMDDEKLARDIAQLFEVGAIGKAAADELLRALHQGSSFFRKELWRHDLSSGLTTITELGRKGEKGRSVTRSNARLMSALFMALEDFDRNAVYVGAKPVDDAAN